MYGEVERVRAAYARRPANDPRYSWFQPGHVFIAQERERAVLAALARHKITRLDTLRVLDVGCGEGFWLGELVKWGAKAHRVVGVDVIHERLRAARHRVSQDLVVIGANGDALPFTDAAFDLVVQSTVFSSILSTTIRRQVASEMLRVLRTGGHILWYDFYIGNPRNPDVRRVGRAEIKRLFPGCEMDVRRVTLAPPIVRRLAKLTRIGSLLIDKFPLLRTHFLGILRKI